MTTTPSSLTLGPLPENVLQLAAELELDVLMECPQTTDATIRFICSVRKDLLEAPTGDQSPELVKAEQLLSRMYHHIGYDRRNQAFTRSARA